MHTYKYPDRLEEVYQLKRSNEIVSFSMPSLKVLLPNALDFLCMCDAEVFSLWDWFKEQAYFIFC